MNKTTTFLSVGISTFLLATSQATAQVTETNEQLSKNYQIDRSQDNTLG
jgi:hypothetical protein